MIEQVKLYDVSHWQHTRFDGWYEVGKTVYNADNYQKPIKKDGKAPCALLDMCYNWQQTEDAIRDLLQLGFVQVDDVTWGCV